MPELSWTAPARADLQRTDVYLSREASGEVAIRTLIAIRERADLLRRFPQAGPMMRDVDFRSLRIHGTRYLLNYRLTGSSVEILRIFHECPNWRDSE